MKRNKIVFITAIVMCLALGLVGCGKKTSETKAAETQAETTTVAATEETTGEAETETQTQAKTQSADIFKDMAGSYMFTSGAGGWSTTLLVNADGSFSGNYTDSDMGDTGEGYPDGTVHYADFTGKFVSPVAKNDYTYTANVSNLKTEDAVGTEKIEAKIRYIATAPYGFDSANTVEIYTPSAPKSKLPEPFITWVQSSLDGNSSTLNKYGFYNVAGQQGWIKID